jgi:hypothetical protein
VEAEEEEEEGGAEIEEEREENYLTTWLQINHTDPTAVTAELAGKSPFPVAPPVKRPPAAAGKSQPHPGA